MTGTGAATNRGRGKAAQDEDKRDPAGAQASTQELHDAGVNAGVTHGSGNHGKGNGDPLRQKVAAELEGAAGQPRNISKSQPAKAAVVSVERRHQQEDDGKAGELYVLDEADGVSQHRGGRKSRNSLGNVRELCWDSTLEAHRGEGDSLAAHGPGQPSVLYRPRRTLQK